MSRLKCGLTVIKITRAEPVGFARMLLTQYSYERKKLYCLDVITPMLLIKFNDATGDNSG